MEEPDVVSPVYNNSLDEAVTSDLGDFEYPDWYYDLPQVKAKAYLWIYVAPFILVAATIGMHIYFVFI